MLPSLLDNHWPYVAATSGIIIIAGHVAVISHQHCHLCGLVNMTVTIGFSARMASLITAATTCDDDHGGSHCNH
jgi:hypothetical protein